MAEYAKMLWRRDAVERVRSLRADGLVLIESPLSAGETVEVVTDPTLE